MIVEPKPFEFGNLKGAIYDFPEIGDILPKHSHVESTAHITIVARGKIRVTAGDWIEDVECGKVVDLPAFQEHEFVSLEPGSRIVNIQKNLNDGVINSES
jgi:quercetin dioxygenase-like cupin family protein